MKHHKIALGTVQFGLHYGISNTQGKTPLAEVKAILASCQEHGVTVIDTASAYGDAEYILGEAGVGNFQVVSKFMPNPNLEAFEQQLNRSLGNLKIQHFYGYLAHRPTELLKQPWEWAALQEKKAQGTIQKIGFSLNLPSELHNLLDQGFYPDLVQVPYSYLDRRFEVDFESLKQAGIEIHTRSTFLQGLLFMEPSTLNSDFDIIKPFLERLLKIDDLTGKLLNFVLSNEYIDSTVIGIESCAQLNANIILSKVSSTLDIDIPHLTEAILLPMNWKK